MQLDAAGMAVLRDLQDSFETTLAVSRVLADSKVCVSSGAEHQHGHTGRPCRQTATAGHLPWSKCALQQCIAMCLI
jgi:hypothetical protein